MLRISTIFLWKKLLFDPSYLEGNAVRSFHNYFKINGVYIYDYNIVMPT